MPSAKTFTAEGRQAGETDLPAAIFGQRPHRAVLHRAVVAEMANRRAGTHSTLTRGRVRGGGRKPWRQKGTGRARHGSRRSPLWVGGGITFGPKPRDYGHDMPRKERALALRSALSARAQAGHLVVIESPSGPQVKTKTVAALLQAIDAGPRPVLVTGPGEGVLARATANIAGVRVLHARRLSVRELLVPRTVILTRPALTAVQEVLGA